MKPVDLETIRLFLHVLAATVWVARSTMHESPEFRRQQEEGTVPPEPLAYALKHHRPGMTA